MMLYQLQRGLPARAPPAPSATRVAAAAMLANSPTSKRKSVPATSKPVSTTAHATAAAAVTSTSSQTQLGDLDPSCIAIGSAGCSRCPCCAVAAVARAPTSSSSGRESGEEEVAALQSRLDASERAHAGEVVGWQQRLKSLREQLASSQSLAEAQAQKMAAMASAASSRDQDILQYRLRIEQQDKALTDLQHKQAADQLWIQKLQAQLQQLQQQQQQQLQQGRASSSATVSSSSSASSSSSSNNNGRRSSLAGLSESELQRQQLALRAGAEQALLRLQQLFPDQHIGGGGGGGGGGARTGGGVAAPHERFK